MSKMIDWKSKDIQIPVEELYGQLFSLNYDEKESSDESNRFTVIQKVLAESMGGSDVPRYSIRKTVSLPVEVVTEIFGDRSWLFTRQEDLKHFGPSTKHVVHQAKK